MKHASALVLLLSLVVSAPLRLAAQMAASIVPFELANNIILVEAEVDGRKGWFFFDSGAPRLALNSAHFKDHAPTGSVQTGAGSTGTHTANQTKVAKFSLGHLVQENLIAGLINLAHLEKATGREVLGIIGYENIRTELVYFDYAAKQVKLLPPMAVSHLPTPRVTVPFTMERHLPVFTAELGGETLKLALDCGAAAGMLDIALAPKLKPLLSTDGEAKVAGAGGTTGGGVERMRGALKLGDTTFGELVFVFMPMGHFRAQGGTFDGVIGYHLLSQGPSAIDYANNRLLFW